VRYGEDYNFIVILPMIFEAWRGLAGLGEARQGMARQGGARRGKESFPVLLKNRINKNEK
jgi:hypothetical protein